MWEGLERYRGSLFVEPLNSQEGFGINLWSQPSSVCQEGGNLAPGLWAAVGFSGGQGCVLYQTPTANMEKKWKVTARICTQPALP